MKFVLVTLAVSSLLLGSCSKFSYADMELDLHYDGESDKLVVLEIERGIHAQESAIGDAIAALEHAATGGRIFPPEQGIALDFDALEASLVDESKKPVKPLERSAAEFAHSVKVVKSGTFLDAEGRLSLFRLWTLTDFKKGIALINATIDEGVLEKGGQDEPFQPSFPVFDIETRELQRERGKTHTPWLIADKNGFVLDLPMTPSSAARCFAYVLTESRKPDVPCLVALWSQVSSVEIKDNRAILRFAPNSGEWMHFAWSWPNEKYSSEMLKVLRENKSFLDETATVNQLRDAMKPR